MRVRVLGTCLAVLLVASACARQQEAPPREKPASEAKAQTFVVQIDGETPDFIGAFNAFFPKELAVHGGDTLEFELPHFTGEPHTVTFGTLVDAAAAKLGKLGGPQPGFAEEAEQEFKQLTSAFPLQESQAPDLNQSAAQPCFLDSGLAPNSFTGGAPACPKKTQPDFNGKQTFFNSGLLMEDGASFTAKVSEDIKPGTYSFMCMIHRGPMTGKITVVDPGKSVPDAEAVKKGAEEELDQIVSQLRPAAEQAAKATPDKAVAGIGVPALFDSLVAEFGPKELSIPKGRSVTWNVFAFHTIALDPPEEAVGLFTKAPDGSFHLNPKGGAPAKGPAPPPGFLNFPQTVSKPATIDGGTFDGSGFKNSGVLASIPPALVSYKVTFTKAGTFELRCLLHPDMKAKVKVG